MGFTIRLLEDGDYENTLVKWWNDWKWDAPAKDFLPQEGRGGIMVSKDDVDICAGFLYFTNSKAAWCEFIVSNKDYKEAVEEETADDVGLLHTDVLLVDVFVKLLLYHNI